MANPKNKKPSTKNSYYWFLLLPIAALVVLAIVLIPKSKHHDWDDDDEDDETSEVVSGSDGPELEWGGNSPAFRKEVAPGIVISARENAFEQPTEVEFRFATEDEDKMVGKKVEQQLEHQVPLFTFSLDAGLEPTQHIPGTFNVEFDLEELEIPEELWAGLRVCRVDDYGNLQEWACRVKDGKFSFDTDRNCLWAITCFTVAAALAAKLGTAASLTIGLVIAASGIPHGFSYLALRTGYGNKPFVYDHFEVPHYGTIRMGFCPEDTEHPEAQKFLEMAQDAEKRILNHQKKAQREADEARDYERTLRNADNPIPIYHDTESRFSFSKIYTKRLANDDELIELLKTIREEMPQSILDVEQMVQTSITYLRDVQQLKLPGSMCGLYLGDKDIVDGKGLALGAYNHYLDMDPWIGILYAGKYVVADGPVIRVEGRSHRLNRIDETEKDKLQMCICHELFHHFQGSYVLNSVFRDLRLAESTASVLEHDFTDWLYRKGTLTYDPRTREGDSKLEFVDRSPKEWLFGSLCEPVTPSSVKFDQLGNLIKASIVAMARLKVQENSHQPFMDPSYTAEADRAAKEALEELSNRARLTKDQLKDIGGFLGEHFGGPNCDVGYMLGDFIDYLRRHKMPSNKLYYILEYGSGWNLAEALKQGFLIESDADFYQFYEGFIKQYLKDIVKRQDYFVTRDTFKIFYRGQLCEPYEVDPQNCVQELSCWSHPGAYACRTLKIKSKRPEDVYNLLLVPSIGLKGDGEKAIKAVILKEDSLFARTPYYLEADSNSNHSPEHVALLFTDQFKGYLTGRSLYDSSRAVLDDDNDYYDAVAYFAPTEKPRISPSADGQFEFELAERPGEILMKKEYVTGVEFVLKDNKTGKPVDSLKVKFPADKREPTKGLLTYPNRQVGEDPDVSGFARWYYQPDPNDTTCYYSPWSKEGDGSSGLIIDNDTRVSNMGFFSDGDRSNFNSIPKGHLKVWSDGRFEWHSPSASRDGMSVSSFSASGKGLLGAELDHIVLHVDGVIGEIDPSSFSSSGLTINERQTNERGEEVTVTTEYSVRSAQGAYVCFKKPASPGATIKVIVCFPKATRKRGNGSPEEAQLEFYGYGEAREMTTNPFVDY